jgi:hypothetical protein
MILIVNDKVVKQIVKKIAKGRQPLCEFPLRSILNGGASVDPNPALKESALPRESVKEEHESLIK